MDRSGAGDKTAVSSMFTLAASPPRLCAATGARRVHQDAPHHLRRHGKKLRALVPFDLGHVYQAEVDLVDQCGGLEGVALAFVLHVPASHEAQFGIDLLRQPLQGSFVAAAPGFQQIRDFRRGCVDG